MPQLTFPIGADGLVVDALVNLEASALLPLRLSGQSRPPLPGRGALDTGSNVSGVSPALLRQLGVRSVGASATVGIGGSYPVQPYRVSLHVCDRRNINLPWFSHPSVVVMGLPAWVSCEVLIGLDVLLSALVTLVLVPVFYVLMERLRGASGRLLVVPAEVEGHAPQPTAGRLAPPEGPAAQGEGNGQPER